MRAAFAFLTPFGRAVEPDRRTFAWFPLVGAVVGAAVGSTWWLAAEVWSPSVAAAIVVAADLAFTGLLHVDGLADSADGLLPPLDRDRRLAVMRSPGVGAFAVAVVGVVLLLRFAAFASVAPDVASVAAIWCASRTAMAAMTTALPYARDDGLASSFVGGNARWPLWIAAIVVAAVVDATAVGGVLAGAALVGVLARRRIGGYTGDVLGASGVVGETVGLLVMAAR